MSISYPKVHLRAIEPEDLDMLYRIENDVKLWNVGIVQHHVYRTVFIIIHCDIEVGCDGT